MKKQLAVILCVLLSFCVMACGSAAPNLAEAAEASPAVLEAPAAEASPAASETPTPSPAAPDKAALEALVAELNEELRVSSERAREEAIAKYQQANGYDGTTPEILPNVAMCAELLEDGRIALKISESFMVDLFQEGMSVTEEAERQELLGIYNMYVDTLRDFQLTMAEDIARRLPGAELVVRLYKDDSFSLLLAQVEKGEIVFDMLNGIDTVGLLASPAPEETPAPATPTPERDPFSGYFY